MEQPHRTAVLVPALAQGDEHPIKMSHWVVKVGQRVEAGARLLDLTVDKADVEVAAPATGVLVEVLRAFGDQVTAGEVIGWLDARVAPWVATIVDQPDATGRCAYCGGLLMAGDLRCRACGGQV